MRTLIILLMMTLSIQARSNANPTSTAKLALTCKVWGFLKYYHPKVARGYMDWDQVLIRSIAFTNSAKSFEELNSFYAGGLISLGKIDRCTTCAEIDTRWFDKNFNLDWTDDQERFAKPIVDALNIIEQNRNQNENYYALRGAAGNIDLSNEQKHDSTMVFPTEEYRLLVLFRYWNAVEYFFPYKYQMDQNWDSVLFEMIPKFRNAENNIDYHLTLMELTAKLNDSHTFYASQYTFDEFGNFFVPVKTLMVDDQLIVSEFYDDSLGNLSGLKPGDEILKIDGVKIDSLINTRYKYIAASNRAVQNRIIPSNILNGHDSTSIVTLDRNGKILQQEIYRYRPKLINWQRESNSKHWQILKDSIGYVDMGILENKEVDTMMMKLINCRAIIFDIRNYPKGTLYNISKYLHNDRAEFVKFTEPDYSYPGRFRWAGAGQCGKSFTRQPVPVFDGKVILLVNEATQSHAEFTAMCLQTYQNCTTIGSQTSGADGNVSWVPFLGVYGSYFSGIGIYYPDSSETQRVGVKVDIEVKPTIQGIRDGRDEVLEFAIDLIKKDGEQK
jgi:carboxyl-terminal processing protease